jgi:hypothetical protein
MTDEVAAGADLLDTVLSDARRRLAGSPRERLGDWAHARLLGFGRAPRIVPVGEAWHVGVLLIADAEVYATGEILRARAEAVRGYTAEAQRPFGACGRGGARRVRRRRGAAPGCDADRPRRRAPG